MSIGARSRGRRRTKRLGVSIGFGEGQRGRVLIASAVIISLLGAAVGVSIWRYEHAINKKDIAIAASVQPARQAVAQRHFWREREAAANTS